jgi:hypothetical protein
VTTVHDRQQRTRCSNRASLHHIYISELLFSSIYTHLPVSQEVPRTTFEIPQQVQSTNSRTECHRPRTLIRYPRERPLHFSRSHRPSLAKNPTPISKTIRSSNNDQRPCCRLACNLAPALETWRVMVAAEIYTTAYSSGEFPQHVMPTCCLLSANINVNIRKKKKIWCSG